MDTQRIELFVEDGIILRQFELNDTGKIFSLVDNNRAHLSQYNDDTAKKYPDLESVINSIKNPPNPLRLRFGIFVNSGIVGSINLTPDCIFPSGIKPEVGYYLGKEFMGKGYMVRSIKRIVRYGFEDLSLREIWARVNKNNQQSKNVLLNAGFSLDTLWQSEETAYFFVNNIF